MPFTVSHAAAVLPFRQWCPRVLIFPALVFGSFAPDFGYFIHLWDLGAFSHTLIGSFVCDIPVSLIMLAVFCKCRLALAALLPSPHQNYWTQWSGGSFQMTPKTILLLSLSTLVGSWTHITWDSFTHSSGWCVLAAPALAAPIANLKGITLPVYKILQYASSAVGLLIVCIFYNRQLTRAHAVDKSDDSRKLARLGLIALSALLVSTVCTFYQTFTQTSELTSDLPRLAFLLLVNAISALVVVFLATACAVSLWHKNKI
jgi:NADH:ubiquinone oxidoreductase subunit 6 (subunit J)